MLALLTAFQAAQELASLQQVLKIVAAAVCSAMTRLTVLLVILEAKVTEAVFSTSVLMICRASQKKDFWRGGQCTKTRLTDLLVTSEAKLTQAVFLTTVLMICRAHREGRHCPA